MIQYFVFQAFNALLIQYLVFSWLIIIIALLFGNIVVYDFPEKLDEDPSAGLKLVVCGIGLVVAAFLAFILLVGLGILDFWLFLSAHFQFAVLFLPTFIQIVIASLLYLIAGYQIRRATISYEPVPPLPNRDRIIVIGGIGFLLMLIGMETTNYVAEMMMQYAIEILFYAWLIVLFTGGVLCFIAAYMYDFASKNRYDKVLLKEIPEDRFICPLCHTALSPRSVRCRNCYHIIPNGIKPR